MRSEKYIYDSELDKNQGLCKLKTLDIEVSYYIYIYIQKAAEQ